jgi:D-xylose transport system substrate-binding protein
MLNGPPGDPGTAAMKEGAHSVLDGQVTIGWERDVPAEEAVQEARRAIAALGPGRVAGVYCATDTMAGRVAAVMADMGVATGTPLVGGGAAQAALRRIMSGSQTATVRTPIAAEALAAARLAVEAGCGKTLDGTTMVSNGTTASIPAAMIPPVLVTRAGAAALLTD